MSNEMVPSVGAPESAIATMMDSFRTGGNNSIISTFAADTPEAKKMLMSALTDSERLDDFVGKRIAIRDFIIQLTDMVDEDGVTRPILRSIVIDADGKAFSAASDGIVKALQTLTFVYGQPATWDAPVVVEVARVQGRRGWKFLTLKQV